MAPRQTRRQLIETAAVGAALLPVLSAQQHSHEAAAKLVAPATSPYTPRFFTVSEYALLAALVDVIIPRTETPGASDAGVPEFIDGVALRGNETGDQIRAGLSWLQNQTKAGGKRFEELGAERQIEIVTPISDNISSEPGRFFRLVKDLTIDGYYSSREGLTTELGWNANTYVAEFKGCTHPEHGQE